MNSRFEASFEEEKQIGLSIVSRTATDFKSLLSVQKLVNANVLVLVVHFKGFGTTQSQDGSRQSTAKETICTRVCNNDFARYTPYDTPVLPSIDHVD